MGIGHTQHAEDFKVEVTIELSAGMVRALVDREG